jgi:hypothetical protein
MLIGYPYSAASQDLWLYADETVVHTGGTTVVKKPVAWNPGSPLYGYRKSLQGISLRRRIVTSAAVSQVSPSTYSQFTPFNDPSDPANIWAYNNCYPMALYAVSKRLLFTCQHCFPSSEGFRNPAEKWSGTVFPVGSLNDKISGFEWMDKDNNITDSFSTADVLAPYDSNASPVLTDTGRDLSLTELPSDLSFEPLKIVNYLNLAPDATVWILDSAMKIVRSKIVNLGVKLQGYIGPSRDDMLLQTVNPAGSANVDVYTYLHDSGSVCLVEISPPTSAAAGDGVLGLVAAHLHFGGSAFIPEFYGGFEVPGDIGAQAELYDYRSYAEAIGAPMTVVAAKRQHTNFVLVNSMDRLLEKVQALQL